MSSDSNENELQFGKAEFEGQSESAAAACFACQSALTEDYFDINGRPTCTACKSSIASGLSSGSRMNRMLKAVLFGGVAGILGALIYFAILKITGYEVGLVAVLVGYMVGKAVFAGSGNRGGAGYQALAIAITYVAIVATYVPFVWNQFDSAEEAVYAQEGGPDSTAAQATDEALDPDLDPVAAAQPAEQTTDASAASIDEQPISGVDMALAIATLLGVILAMPFLAGMENIIGLLIIGFGLFQAWSLNRKSVLTINGPFRVQPAQA